MIMVQRYLPLAAFGSLGETMLRRINAKGKFMARKAKKPAKKKAGAKKAAKSSSRKTKSAKKTSRKPVKAARRKTAAKKPARKGIVRRAVEAIAQAAAPILPGGTSEKPEGN